MAFGLVKKRRFVTISALLVVFLYKEGSHSPNGEPLAWPSVLSVYMYFVYILQSTTKKRFYIGATQNVNLRLKEHNRGTTKSTKPYRPWVLIYSESYIEKTSAMKREWHLKHPKGFLEKKRIISDNSRKDLLYKEVA